MSAYLGSFASAAANATWRDASFATTHLQPHAGRTLRVEIVPPFVSKPIASFAMRVTGDGGWESVGSGAASEVHPDATLRLTHHVGLALAQAPDKPGSALDLAGDPAFVAALRDLHDVLPLAIEDRVSSVVGPIAAHALMSAFRAAARWPAQATGSVSAGTSSWMTEERRMLVGRATFDGFARDVADISKRLEQLLQRHPSHTAGD